MRELLAAGNRPVRRVRVASGVEPSEVLDEIERLAMHRRVPLQSVSRGRLAAEARTEAPQGVIAIARPLQPVDLGDLCRTEPGPPFVLVASGLTDPQNLGSVLRSAECAGVTGVVLPRHRAAHLTPAVAKVAAGAIEHLPFAVVGGVPAALTFLASAGLQLVGLAPDAGRSLYDLSLGDTPVALVVGSEDRGLSRLERRRCDEVVAIPQHGSLASLNAGVAAAVAFFEVARQRAQVTTGNPRLPR